MGMPDLGKQMANTLMHTQKLKKIDIGDSMGQQEEQPKVSAVASLKKDDHRVGYLKQKIKLRELGDYNHERARTGKDLKDPEDITPQEVAEAIQRIRNDKLRKQLPTMKKVATDNPWGHKTSIHVDVHQTLPGTKSGSRQVKITPENYPKSKKADCITEQEPFNPLPLSSDGLSAGATDPTVGILDLSEGVTTTPYLPDFDTMLAVQNQDYHNI